MSLKACIFRNCGNYINLKDRRNDDVKLFSFPKNPERYKKWIEIGKVPLNLPNSMYYFCSDHFDKKYFAVNNRRTVLVGEAIPNPYVEAENTESNEDDSLNNYLFELNKDNHSCEKTVLPDEQDILVESTTITTEIQDNFEQQYSGILYEELEPEEVIVYTDSEKNNQDYSPNYGNKRKLDKVIEDSSPKRKSARTSSPKRTLRKPFGTSTQKNAHEMTSSKSASTSSNPINIIELNTKERNEDDITDDLVDEKHVTTFIFKGEEYVQMPKDHYINEKMEMRNKIQEMEHTLKTIKDHLNSLDI